MEGTALRYVACLDAKMPPRASKEAAETLNTLRTARCPFPEIPERERGNAWSGGMTEEDLRTAVWVKPKHTAEVTFLEWTRGGFLRHAQVKQVLAPGCRRFLFRAVLSTPEPLIRNAADMRPLTGQ
jgi:hypothetical protein